MDTKSMTRKEFVTLTFTLLGGAATVAACSSSSNNNGTGGTNGSAGATGIGATCANPLPETQVADATGHFHTVMIQASLLDAATDQTITTGPATPDMDGGTVSAHMHMVTLTVANLATLKGGGQVTVTSQPAGLGPHTHMYMVSCGAVTSTGGTNGAAGTSGAAGISGAAGGSGAAGISGAAGA
ncbi:MAG TPA: hypothetical protein VH853_20730 [Polyangia bacterium]|nr:hypothetical protein [Polyangia bacterium]